MPLAKGAFVMSRFFQQVFAALFALALSATASLLVAALVSAIAAAILPVPLGLGFYWAVLFGLFWIVVLREVRQEMQILAGQQQRQQQAVIAASGSSATLGGDTAEPIASFAAPDAPLPSNPAHDGPQDSRSPGNTGPSAGSFLPVPEPPAA